MDNFFTELGLTLFQVDQLVYEDLVRERFPKLGSLILYITFLFVHIYLF